MPAPGHQYPQCSLNIHCIGPVSYKNIAHKANSIRKWNHILRKKWPSHLKVKQITHYQSNVMYLQSVGGHTECVNSSLPGQNGRHFADDIFRRIFVNEKVCILIKFSLKFVPNGPIDNDPALVWIMAWRRIGDKPLSEPKLTRFTDWYMRH